MATTPGEWQGDKGWSDRFIPQIKVLLANLFIQESTVKEDQEQATDLRVFSVRNYCVACRLRRSKFLWHYPHDITIRSGRPSGRKTEFEKILIDGWGDYYFYGFGHDQSGTIPHWLIVDLRVLRWVYRNLRETIVFGNPKLNRDNSSEFVYIRTDSIRYCIHDHSANYWDLPAALQQVRSLALRPL